ncbi:hypothetical protein HD554DRAFT_2324700 [Boletus coccyginus]|nr:hypothetical protein HD554DRAFT_2324700 [Boletus coccyginus]
MFSYYVMAVLVQLPPAGFYRAALLPVVFWATLRASMSLDFSGNDLGHSYMNQALTLGMFLIAMRSTVWVFAPRPYTRLPISKSGNSSIDGRNGDTPTPTEHGIPIFSAMWNALDLTVNLRGIGWDGFPTKHTPTPNFQVESRSTFVLLTLGRLVILGLVFDILSTCIHLLGPDTFGTPKGGTIFDPSLTSPERYMKSFIITLLSGFAPYVTIDGTYQPPLLDSPWLSTSLTSFLGRRWHQLFRSKPLERYLGRVGSVIAAFALSGVLHDIGIRGMGRCTDTLSVAGFFVMHGVGVAMEHAWKRATGRRVGGIIGWLWTGLIGIPFFPDAYRPTTLFLNWMFRKNVAS